MDLNDTLPEFRHEVRQGLQVYERYALNKVGITYAQQGFHLGDGVTLWAEIVATHIFIEGLYGNGK